jgi:putative membrane protein
MKENLQHIVKGVAMGAANIIPGVSGGTIALITGIFERLINAIKSIDLIALKLLFTGKWNSFTQKTDFWFLVRIFAGVGIAIFSLARLFDFLFTHYPVFIWSYFFGLILASVYYVGITVEKWTLSAVLSFIIGAAVAIAITFMSPAAENRDFFYLILCGMVAVCSMILPGISGSFVLILMGNYQLVAIEAVNNLDLKILTPVLIGMVVGLILFSHLLSWLFKTFKNQTIASLTGFIFGSLGVIWPWKETIFVLDSAGAQVIKKGKPLVERYISVLPEQFGTNEMLAIALVIAGILTIWLVEKSASVKTESNQA